MPRHGAPDEKLVGVFDTREESEAMVVQGLLESAGIESMISGTEATQEILPGVGGTVVMVREEQAGEARRLINEFRAHPAAGEDESE